MKESTTDGLNGEFITLETAQKMANSKKPLVVTTELITVSKHLLRSDNAMFINDNFRQLEKAIYKIVNYINEMESGK